MHADRHIVSVTTASDGSATAYTPVVTGRVLSIRYLKTDFADGSTITVTAEATGEAIWTETGVNASATRYPRAQVCGPTGTALTYDGTRTINEPVVVAKDRVKIVVASGGNVKSGAFHVVIG
jgi:hypothetical protein